MKINVFRYAVKIYLLFILFPFQSTMADWVQTKGPVDPTSIYNTAIGSLNGIIFIGLYEKGVYLSGDSGNSWHFANTGLPSNYVISFAVCGNNLFVSPWCGGVYLFNNNDSSWIPTNTGLNLRVYDLAVAGNNIFAGTSTGVYRTTDSGKNWQAVNSGLPASDIISVTVCGNNIFAVNSGNIYRSSDNGSSWISTNNGFSSNNNFKNYSGLSVSGNNIFAFGGDTLYYSSNNGTAWQPILNTNLKRIQSLVGNGSDVYAAVQQGLFHSINNGINWQKVTGIDSNAALTSISFSGNDICVGGRYCGVFLSHDSGINWQPINSGLMFSQILNLISKDSSLIATSCDQYSANGSIFMSTSEGDIWTKVFSNSSNVTALASNANYVFGATANSRFISSINGINWQTVDTTSIISTSISTLTCVDSVIYAGTKNGRIFVSSNNGISWVGLNTINLSSSNSVNAIANSGKNIFSGLSNDGIYLSTNNGISWQPRNYGLSDLHITSLVINGNLLFAGTQNGGVFISSDSGSVWSAANTGLPLNAIQSLLVCKGNIFAAIKGKGIFASSNNGTSWTAVNSGLLSDSAISLTANNKTMFASIKNDGVWRRPISEMVGIIYQPAKLQMKYYSFNITPSSIRYEIKSKGFVDISLFTISGKKIGSFENGVKSAGKHFIALNKYRMPSGVYTYRFQFCNHYESGNIVLRENH